MFVLQTVFDAELLLPQPSWVSYAPQARLAGRPVRWLPTDLVNDGGRDEIEDYLRRSRIVLKHLGKEIAVRMRASGIRVGDPEGGFYLMPDFSQFAGRLAAAGIATSSEMCERMLQETGVAMLPGSCFGFPDGDLNARLAYVDFDGGAALAAAARSGGELDGGFSNTHCGRVVEAIERVCEWLETGVNDRGSG